MLLLERLFYFNAVGKDQKQKKKIAILLPSMAE
jgi:hypothetical protein